MSVDDDNAQRYVDLTRELINKGQLVDSLSDKINELERIIETSDNNTSSNSMTDEDRTKMFSLMHITERQKQSLTTVLRCLSLERKDCGDIQNLLSSSNADITIFIKTGVEAVGKIVKRTEKVLRDSCDEKVRIIASLRSEVIEQTKKFDEAERVIEERENKIDLLNRSVNEIQGEVSRLRDENGESDGRRVEAENTVESLGGEIQNLRAAVQEKNEEFITLKNTLHTSRIGAGEAASNREVALRTSEGQVATLTKEVNEVNAEKLLVEERVEAGNLKIRDLNSMIAEGEERRREREREWKVVGEECEMLRGATEALTGKLEISRREGSEMTVENNVLKGEGERKRIVN